MAKTNEQTVETVPERRDPTPNQGVYAQSRRAELSGLDPDFCYQLVNDAPMGDGRQTEAETKAAGYEHGYEGVGYTWLQWEMVRRSEVSGGRLRNDDAKAGTDGLYRTGGQVLMRIPRAAMANKEFLDAEQQKRISAAMAGGEKQQIGRSTFGAKIASGLDASTSAVASQSLGH
jgi:hypothetical protein